MKSIRELTMSQPKEEKEKSYLEDYPRYEEPQYYKEKSYLEDYPRYEEPQYYKEQFGNWKPITQKKDYDLITITLTVSPELFGPEDDWEHDKYDYDKTDKKIQKLAKQKLDQLIPELIRAEYKVTCEIKDYETKEVEFILKPIK